MRDQGQMQQTVGAKKRLLSKTSPRDNFDGYHLLFPKNTGSNSFQSVWKVLSSKATQLSSCTVINKTDECGFCLQLPKNANFAGRVSHLIDELVQSHNLRKANCQCRLATSEDESSALTQEDTQI